MCNNVTTFYDNNLLGGHPESPSTFYVVSFTASANLSNKQRLQY